MSVRVVLLAYRNTLLARTWNSQGHKFVNIFKNKVLLNISRLTVLLTFTSRMKLILSTSMTKGL